MTDQPLQSPTGEQPTLLDYLAVLRRWWLLVVGFVLLGLVFGGVVLPKLAAPDEAYVATVRVQMQPLPDAVEPNVVQANQNRREAPPDPTDSIREEAVMETTLAALGDDAGRLTATQDVPESEWADAALSSLEADTIPGTTDLTFSYSDGDPDLAMAVVSTYAEEYAKFRNGFYQQEMARLIETAEQRAQAQFDELLALTNQADTERVVSGAGTTTTTQVLLDLARARYAERAEQHAELVDTLAERPEPTLATEEVGVERSDDSTSTLLLAIIGLLLGTAVGVGLALVLESLLNRVSGVDDVAATSMLPVLAVVPSSGRADDGVTVLSKPNGPAADGLQRARMALEVHGLGRGTDVVAVTSPGRRDGRSTVVINLAEALAAEGRDVVLVCADARNPSIETFYGLDGKPGLTDAVIGGVGMVSNLLVQVSPGLSVLPVGNAGRGATELLRVDQLRRVLNELRRYGIVLVDTPAAGLSAEAFALAAASDAAVVIARAGHTRRDTLNDLCARLEQYVPWTLGTVLLGHSGALSTRAQLHGRRPVVEIQPALPEQDSPDRPIQSMPASGARGGKQPEALLPATSTNK